MSDTKITIGVLSQGTLKTEMASCLVMAACATNVPLHMVFYQGVYIHESRNKVAEAAIKEGSTHLMFIDYDMVFPENGITTLLGRRKEIIGGLYNARKFPLKLAAFGLNSEGFTRQMRHDEIPTEPFKIGGIGAGFLLIETGVFNKIEQPYFSVEPWGNGVIGEDVYFCIKAGKVGIEVWADPTIPIKHIGDYAY